MSSRPDNQYTMVRTMTLEGRNISEAFNGWKSRGSLLKPRVASTYVLAIL